MAFNIAFRILENREEAEEVVQDAFVKMYRALPSFQFGCKFSTWFYKIVYNTAITAQRKQSLFESYDDAVATDLTTSEVDSATAILEREDRKEIIARVLKSYRLTKAWCLLSFTWRSVLLLTSVRSRK